LADTHTLTHTHTQTFVKASKLAWIKHSLGLNRLSTTKQAAHTHKHTYCTVAVASG